MHAVTNPNLNPNPNIELTFKDDIRHRMAISPPPSDDILISSIGTVYRVVNGLLLEEPLLDIDTANRHEWSTIRMIIA